MIREQRTAFDELITAMRAGRMTRRRFLERALGIGLSTAASLSLLESCSQNGINLIWQSEFDLTTAYQDLVDRFNRENTHGIHVTLRSIQPGTNDLTVYERSLLHAQSAAVDIFSIDIIVVPEFASRQWIKPISESQWPTSARSKYLSAPIDACTFNGQIWAAPYRTDVGLLYYRTDLVGTPPRTWDDLMTISRKVLKGSHPRELQYGYVWQASQYEGLVCNFVEVLYGYGGSILDPSDPTHVTVFSPQAIEALATMVGWINTISPPDITNYQEEVARQTWESGQAIFMRNWPYVIANAMQTPLAGKFAIHPMLYGGHNTVGHSTIGGWQLAINSFIAPEKQTAAWEFIQYMLGKEAQAYGAEQASWLVTLKSIYNDPVLQKKFPLFQQIQPILEMAQPRPRTPNYDAVSQAIRIRVRQALQNKDVAVSEVLRMLADDLKPLVATFS